MFADFHLFEEILCGGQRDVAEQAAGYLDAFGRTMMPTSGMRIAWSGFLKVW